MGRVEIIGYDEPQNFPGIEPGSDADKKLREMLAENQFLRQQLEERERELDEYDCGEEHRQLEHAYEAATKRYQEAEQQLEQMQEAVTRAKPNDWERKAKKSELQWCLHESKKVQEELRDRLKRLQDPLGPVLDAVSQACTILKADHVRLGEACGVDACALCLIQTNLEAALAELEKGELVGMKPESLDAIREMERIDRAAELEKGEA